MGAVYEALDQRLRRTVALKETLVTINDLRRAFEREARLLANLNHPSLPRVIDHFSEDAGQYLVMDYIPGDDLKALLEKQGHPFPVYDVMRWANDLLEALEYLHTHEPPVIHRDIKPSNLKLSANGKVVLLDFGLAKGSAGQMTVATLGQTILGHSPHFAPLEQIQGDKTTPRSDLYALAATLYNLLSNRMPSDALTRATAMLDDETDSLQPLNDLNPEVPMPFVSLINQALALRAGAAACECRRNAKATSKRKGISCQRSY
jgi:serine/threonine protein kinase